MFAPEACSSCLLALILFHPYHRLAWGKEAFKHILQISFQNGAAMNRPAVGHEPCDMQPCINY